MKCIQNYSVANYQQPQRNVSFGARLRSEDIYRLIGEANYPELYTLLKALDGIEQGKEAAIVGCFGDDYDYDFEYEDVVIPTLKIEGRTIWEGHPYSFGSEYGNYYKFKTLKSAILNGYKMPQSLYEQQCWENRNATSSDIHKLAYHA